MLHSNYNNQDINQFNQSSTSINFTSTRCCTNKINTSWGTILAIILLATSALLFFFLAPVTPFHMALTLMLTVAASFGILNAAIDLICGFVLDPILGKIESNITTGKKFVGFLRSAMAVTKNFAFLGIGIAALVLAIVLPIFLVPNITAGIFFLALAASTGIFIATLVLGFCLNLCCGCTIKQVKAFNKSHSQPEENKQSSSSNSNNTINNSLKTDTNTNQPAPQSSYVDSDKRNTELFKKKTGNKINDNDSDSEEEEGEEENNVLNQGLKSKN